VLLWDTDKLWSWITVIYGQMPDHAYSEVSDVNKAIDSNVYVKATDYTAALTKFQNFSTTPNYFSRTSV